MIPYLALPPGKKILIIDPESPFYEKTATVVYLEGDIIFCNVENSIEAFEFTVYQITPEL
jgi:hypothetical protein